MTNMRPFIPLKCTAKRARGVGGSGREGGERRWGEKGCGLREGSSSCNGGVPPKSSWGQTHICGLSTCEVNLVKTGRLKEIKLGPSTIRHENITQLIWKTLIKVTVIKNSTRTGVPGG